MKLSLYKKEHYALKTTIEMAAEDLLKMAQKLYTEGKWTESVALIEKNMIGMTDTEDFVEANRILGWSYYYLGIKGPVTGKIPNLLKSKSAFEKALRVVPVFEKKKEMSIYNGLPLTLWVLGKKKKALEVSDTAVKIFHDEPSVWNTRCILLRWKGAYKESVEKCERWYSAAMVKGDLLTAGHMQQNCGDAHKALKDIDGARESYRIALERYQKYEETSGKSATAHIESVKKKLVDLVVTIDE